MNNLVCKKKSLFVWTAAKKGKSRGFDKQKRCHTQSDKTREKKMSEKRSNIQRDIPKLKALHLLTTQIKFYENF